MTISAQSIFDGLLPERLSLKSEADYFAPSNIALSKYWGKRDKELNLPLNSSLSISLHKWGSQTKISLAENGRDKVCLNGEAVGLEQPFARKLIAFVDRFRRGQELAAQHPNLQFDTNRCWVGVVCVGVCGPHRGAGSNLWFGVAERQVEHVGTDRQRQRVTLILAWFCAMGSRSVDRWA